MNTVFVDTSSLIAIGNRRDSFHIQAVSIRDKLKKEKRNFVTTNAILFEFGNAFSPPVLKPAAVKMIEAVTLSQKWNCINIDDSLMKKSIELYKKMNDKAWGLVDCSSIIVAKKYGHH